MGELQDRLDSFYKPSTNTTWRHGIDDDEYDRLFELQGGRCAICLDTKDRLVIDHDHDCCPTQDYRSRNCGLCVRGLICTRCNLLIGYIETTGEGTLKRAFDYIAGQNPRGYQGRNLDPLRLKVGSKVA